MSVINTNISATLAANAIRRNDRAMETAMERLSTGLRINSAKDDAAGLAVSTRMAAVVSGLQMASKNANDAISMLEVAEGATLEINNMLIRMRELAVQSASGTYSDTDREALNLEFGALIEEIDRIAKNTTWNTMSILDGGDATRVTSAAAKVTSLNIQLGPDASQVMTVELKSWVPSTAIDAQSDSKGTGANGVDPSVDTNSVDTDGDDVFDAGDGVFDADSATEKANNTAFGGGALFYGSPGIAIDIKNSANSSHAITQLDLAILGASNERARYGAYMSRLEHSSDNLLNVAQNTDQSRSRIEDADYAIETSELARTQIISQAATAMLAQANQAKQNVLSLLQ